MSDRCAKCPDKAVVTLAGGLVKLCVRCALGQMKGRKK